MKLLRITAKLGRIEEEYILAVEELKREIFTELKRIGEIYVSTAKSDSRAKKVYTDRSGNLRSANSYAVYEDGVTVFESIGRQETRQMFEDMKEGKGIELIVGDGMNYASFVEGRSYDVSKAGFEKVESEVRRLAAKWQG
jgi:hypothetical protein